jgi:hypothetical protein
MWPPGGQLIPRGGGNTPNIKDGWFDYQGPTGDVTLPALPAGVTLIVIDEGPSSMPSAASSSLGPLIFAGFALVGLVVFVALKR